MTYELLLALRFFVNTAPGSCNDNKPHYYNVLDLLTVESYNHKTITTYPKLFDRFNRHLMAYEVKLMQLTSICTVEAVKQT